MASRRMVGQGLAIHYFPLPLYCLFRYTERWVIAWLPHPIPTKEQSGNELPITGIKAVTCSFASFILHQMLKSVTGVPIVDRGALLKMTVYPLTGPADVFRCFIRHQPAPPLVDLFIGRAINPAPVVPIPAIM